MNKGKVFFIGAGPGDFELLTLKGKRYLEMADCVIYDRLVNKRILSFVNNDAEFIYLGKENTEGGTLQKIINDTLVEKALSGNFKNIVRLKGGDSFVFGRGGEEIEALNKYNIEFELVPGITSAISVPEYSGIPVTHRNIARSFHVFTGSTADGEGIQNFEIISKLEGTLIFLMGVKNLENICDGLIKNGKNPNTPIGIIEKGTTTNQKTYTTILKDIDKIVDKVTPPAIVIIGEVVNKREMYNWFEKKPLFGKKIIVTREKTQGEIFSREIEKKGGESILLPTIKLTDSMDKFDYSTLKNYQGIMFNSPNGVDFFFKHIPDIRIISNIKIGAIGSKTASQLKKYKIIPNIVPEEYLSENLAKSMTEITKENDNILIITSDVSPISEKELSEKYKRNFKKFIGYFNSKIEIKREILERNLKNATHITFFSGSAVENFFSNLEEISLLPNEIKIISLGPSTTKVIKKYIDKNIIQCEVYTSEEVLKVLESN
ncbi:MAG: uroporphyrinogen-III C-methyltransferase [Fusobacterium perfoetens]|uniref:uroporphyrinogen-III C-methyltransferase n=1 Tax=Fusobacterium perfoetens TaxID=852 RepID=UPI0023F09E44|nr:uroporphyrinogen-III C-methyltransferase [Fusobacterium perfoetens]MCI6151673.1 uroporphyrinogen-III C-methyltransferase [Fusobacterium perfoetens]MDY3236571.1 uroporphyrinogen-III C-methyltransferase [Fusobacterium perfoetens]